MSLISLPHIFYDSLYVKAGSPLPPTAHFFLKHLDMAVYPLWYDGNEANEIGLEETNMRMAGRLPEPETFEICSQFVTVLATDPHDIALVERCAFETRIGLKSSAGIAEVVRGDPKQFFRYEKSGPPGNLITGPIVKPHLKALIPAGYSFCGQMKRGLDAPVSKNLRLWYCLYGTWTGEDEWSGRHPNEEALETIRRNQRR